MRRNFKNYKRGTVISASDLNKRSEIANWFSKLRVEPPLQLMDTACGPLLRLTNGNSAQFWIQVTYYDTASQSYSWQEVLPAGAGTWSVIGGAYAYTDFPAYELNGQETPINRVVLAQYSPTSLEILFAYNQS
jgi:hypothetical protein